MNIKYSTRFSVKKNGQIICRVKYGSLSSGKMQNAIDLYIGYYGESIKWDGANQCPLRGTTHKVGKHVCTAAQINRAIAEYNSCIDTTVRFFEGNDYVPTTDDFKQILMQKMIDKGIKEEKQKPKEHNDLDDINKAWATFINEGETLNGWQPNTTKKFITLKNRLNNFRPNLRLSDFSVTLLQQFQTYLINKRSKKDDKPYHNATINADFKRLRWFFGWCKEKGLIDDADVIEYNPKLKDTEDKEVIFLTYEEFMQLYDYQPTKGYLQHTKDLFIFQCATGLRYSDLASLKRSNISNGFIRLTTQKTTHNLTIKLNKFASAILDKYSSEVYPNDLALPPLSNQKMNLYLKELCMLAKIDDTINIVFRSGGKRIESTHPKYELIGTHSARRTFVSVSLSLGATPEQIQTITGHHSYVVMKNYIGISDADRNKATEVWDDDDAHKSKYLEHIKSFNLDTLKALSKINEQELLNLINK